MAGMLIAAPMTWAHGREEPVPIITDVSNPAAVAVECTPADGGTFQLVWVRGSPRLMLGVLVDGGQWHITLVRHPGYAVPPGASARKVKKIMYAFIKEVNPVAKQHFAPGDRVVGLVGNPAANNPVDHGRVHADGARLVGVSVSWDDGHGSVVPADSLRREISPDMAGTWLDGQYGWRNTSRVIDRAIEHGMILDAEGIALVDWYREHGGDYEPDAIVASEAVNEISIDATDYLRALMPTGYDLQWEAGELQMVVADLDDGDPTDYLSVGE
jgi:hypothetical protein